MRSKWVSLFFCVAALKAQSSSAQIQAHVEKARAALSRHDLESASKEYALILELDPRNGEIQAAQGATLYALGRPAEAVRALESASKINSNQPNTEIFLGLSRADLGQCSRAVPLLQKHFEDRTEAKLRRIVGLSLLNCYGAASEYDRALDLSRSLNRLYGDDPDVLYNVAELYSQLSKAAVNDLLKKHPESARIHQLAGEALEAQGNYSQAIKEYRKALEIDPKLPRIHYRIGSLIALQGSNPESDRDALEQFQYELANNPADAASSYQIGEILRNQHRLTESRTYFLRALDTNRDFVEAHIGLAKVYAAGHQPENALKELEEAIRLRPGDSGSHYALMMAYRDLGRTEDAQREQLVFQKLESEKEQNSRAQLEQLLTGKRTER